MANFVMGNFYETTLASLVPELVLTTEETDALVDFLSQIIINYIEDRRLTSDVPWDLWDSA